MTSVRIVCVDYYMSSPVPGFDVLNSAFRGSVVSKVPVIRVFGSTRNGEKACVHVHNVFPYIYIPFEGKEEPNSVSYKIASALDKALNVSMGHAESRHQHIYKISLISAIPFYGYHAHEHQFLKIYFYNPMMVKRACSILENGNILGKAFQPHESHIPYIQQFMIDYNLHGMNFLNTSQESYRTKNENDEPRNGLDPVSCCKWEIDVHEEHISNVLGISQASQIVNPGIEYILEDERQRRRNKNQDSQLLPCLTLDRQSEKATLTHVKYQQLLLDKLTNKSAPNQTFESSVYAAETPSSQSTLSGGTGIDMDATVFEDDDAVMDSLLDSSVLDEDAALFMAMVKDNKVDVEKEDDCILSQLLTREEDDCDDGDLDLSQSIQIPQLDGPPSQKSRDKGKKKTRESNKIMNQLKNKDEQYLNVVEHTKSDGGVTERLQTCSNSKDNRKGTKANNDNKIHALLKHDLASDKPQLNVDKIIVRDGIVKGDSATSVSKNILNGAPLNTSVTPVCGDSRKLPKNVGTDVSTQNKKAASHSFSEPANTTGSIDENNLELDGVITRSVVKRRLNSNKNSINSESELQENCEQPSKKQRKLPGVKKSSSKNDENNSIMQEVSVVVPNTNDNNTSNKVSKQMRTVESTNKLVNVQEIWKIKVPSAKPRVKKDSIEKSCNCKQNFCNGACHIAPPAKPEHYNNNAYCTNVNAAPHMIAVKRTKGSSNKNVLSREIKSTNCKKAPEDKKIKTKFHAGESSCTVPAASVEINCSCNNPSCCGVCDLPLSTSHDKDDRQHSSNNTFLVDSNNISSQLKKRKKQSNGDRTNAVLPETTVPEGEGKARTLHPTRSSAKRRLRSGITSKKTDCEPPKIVPVNMLEIPINIECNCSSQCCNESCDKSPLDNRKNNCHEHSNNVLDVTNSNNISSQLGAVEGIVEIINGDRPNVVKSAMRTLKGKVLVTSGKIEEGIMEKVSRKYEKPSNKFVGSSNNNDSGHSARSLVKHRFDSAMEMINLECDMPERGKQRIKREKKHTVKKRSNGLKIAENNVIVDLTDVPAKIGCNCNNRSCNGICDMPLLIHCDKDSYEDSNKKANLVNSDIPLQLSAAEGIKELLNERNTTATEQTMPLLEDQEKSLSRLKSNMESTNPVCKPLKRRVQPTKHNGMSKGSRKTSRLDAGGSNCTVNRPKATINIECSCCNPNCDGSCDMPLPSNRGDDSHNNCTNLNKVSSWLKGLEGSIELLNGDHTNVVDPTMPSLEYQGTATDCDFTSDEKKIANSKSFKNAINKFTQTSPTLRENPVTLKISTQQGASSLFGKHKHYQGTINARASNLLEKSKIKENPVIIDLTDDEKWQVQNYGVEIKKELDAVIDNQMLTLKKFYQSASRSNNTQCDKPRKVVIQRNRIFHQRLEQLDGNCDSDEEESGMDESSRKLLLAQPSTSKGLLEQKSPLKKKLFDRNAPSTSSQILDTSFNRNYSSPKKSNLNLFNRNLNITTTEEIIDCLYGTEELAEARIKKELETMSSDLKSPEHSTVNFNTTIQHSSAIGKQHDESGLSRTLKTEKSTKCTNCTKACECFCTNEETKKAFHGASVSTFQPMIKPPSRAKILSSLQEYNLPLVRNRDPFYGDPRDVTGSVEIGSNVLKIEAKTGPPPFNSYFKGLHEQQKALLNVIQPEIRCPDYLEMKQSLVQNRNLILTPLLKPPSAKELANYRKEQREVPQSKIEHTVPLSPNGSETDDLNITISLSPVQKHTSHQITGISLDNTYGFQSSIANLQDARMVNEHHYLTTLVVELHIHTRGNLKPNPELDALGGLFYSLLRDSPNSKVSYGIIAINSLLVSPNKAAQFTPMLNGTGVNCEVTYVNSEEKLFDKFLEMIRCWDPDIFIGYEIEMLSWGYLVERAYKLGINFHNKLSRVPTSDAIKETDENPYGGLKFPGRIVLDMWRLMRHEIALQSYTLENVAYHILHERIPEHAHKDLTCWWINRTPKIRARTALYYLTRVQTEVKLLDQLDLIGRTTELAKLFGIQFYEVLSRGSQFRVESMMLRLAKPQKYIPVSPSVQQRAKMRAPEFLPLIMEPESKYYKDPVIVLDFQSLYPSIIIGYNYCFSTCIGRVEHLGGNSPFEFGATQYKISRSTVETLAKKDLLNFSPCGVGYVKKSVRFGVMPRMLQEILDTRLHVKEAMKDEKGNKVMQRTLHSRQLGLKLIANVTYGYTAANFSGRMPAVELGDSVVAKGRETLQRAINMVERNKEWGSRVVYGDTDSMFVLVPGRSREEAFRIGTEIADAVTNDNPAPIKLKLEKVYQPCILQTKKRYVGYMYESVEQEVPQFQAKGIETVRRDGCPAASKMLEKCLRLLFDTQDVSLVKSYVLRQFDKIISGRVSIQDFTFAKEYRGMDGYKKGACVPALELTKKWKSIDVRNEPRSGERVPYVIIHGPPGLPLIKLVRSPREVLADSSLKLNALYYITKAIIPPINRCFLLLGANLHTWFNGMPRKQVQNLYTTSPTKGPKSTISQYFAVTSCITCGNQTSEGICDDCRQNTQNTVLLLQEKLRIWERKFHGINKICQSCCSRMEDTNCISLDCPVYYSAIQANRDLQQVPFVRGIVDSLVNDRDS